MIENSAKGQNWMFRNLYAAMDGREEDILQDGGLSCAVFASAVLYLNNLIKGIHSTVGATEMDLSASGWTEIKELKIGAVLVWEGKKGKDGIMHKHVGFYIGNNEAVSNDSKETGFPRKHSITYDDTRKIEKIYWHKILDD